MMMVMTMMAFVSRTVSLIVNTFSKLFDLTTIKILMSPVSCNHNIVNKDGEDDDDVPSSRVSSALFATSQFSTVSEHRQK